MTNEEDAAVRAIRAGIEMLVADPQRVLDRGLRIEEVFERAGVSHATFYRRFGTKEKFLSELVQSLVDLPASTVSSARARVEQELASNSGDVRQSVRALAGSSARSALDDDALAHRLLAMIFGCANTRTKRALEITYQRRDEIVLAGFDVLAGRHGVTLRKPFTARNFSMLLTAITDGLTLRRRVDPTAVSADFLADAVAAVASAAVSLVDDHGHIDDILEAMAVNTVSAPHSVPQSPRTALVAAAREQFRRRGYYTTSFEMIATAAGVGMRSARRVFPTKQHIIVGALKARYAELAEAIEDDIAVDRDETTVLNNYLVGFAQLSADEPEFMDAMMVVIAHDTYSEPEGMIAIKENLDFPALITEVIERGQQSGRFASAYPPRELAVMVTNYLLLRCFTRRAAPPAETAEFVRSTVLDGLLVR